MNYKEVNYEDKSHYCFENKESTELVTNI